MIYVFVRVFLCLLLFALSICVSFCFAFLFFSRLDLAPSKDVGTLRIPMYLF